MTNREKILAGSLGAAVVLIGGLNLVQNRIIAPLRDKRNEVVALQQRQEALQTRLMAAASTQELWRTRTAATLHADPFEAHHRFRVDVENLLKRAGLTNLSVRQRDPREEKKGVRNGFVELPVSITAEGNLSQLVAFMKDFYQRPYLTRITWMTVNASGAAAPAAPANRRNRNAPAASAGGDEPKLSVSIVAAALVLPPQPGVPSRALDPNKVEEPTPGMLAEDPNHYAEVVSANLFKLYVPPPPPKVEPPPVETPPVAVAPPPKIEPPPPPAEEPHLTLIAVMGNGDDLVAWVRDDRRKDEPPTRVRLNDPLTNGKVLLIHPRGIVVRIPPPAGQPGNPTDYFYRLGKVFTERTPLDPAEHAEVLRELAVALRPPAAAAPPDDAGVEQPDSR